MSWAANRRLLIIAGALFVVIIILVAILALTLPKKPTCTDGFQNQDEAGIDCGGTCAYLCKVSVVAPAVEYVRGIESHGRIDVVGLVENRNPTAAVKGATYSVEVFSPDGTLIASTGGIMDLPAGERVPLFIPGIASAGPVIGQAFLSFNDASLQWYRSTDVRKLPRADAIQLSGDVNAPRVTANLFNPSAYALSNVVVVATVYDAEGLIIGASKTLAETVAPESSVPLTFTWSEPFPVLAGSVEVRALVPLP